MFNRFFTSRLRLTCFSIVGGILVGLLSTVFITLLSVLFDIGAIDSTESIKELFSSFDFNMMLFTVVTLVIAVPFIEELFFRSILWRLFTRFMSYRVVIVLTSVLFATAHIEILHIIGVLPLSFFIGWLRHKSGSVFPCMVAHASNNALACCLLLMQLHS